MLIIALLFIKVNTMDKIHFTINLLELKNMNTEIKFNQLGWATIQQPNNCFYFIQKMFDGNGNLFGFLVHYNDDENGTMEFVCTALVLDQALEKIKAHQKLRSLKVKGEITTNIRRYMSGLTIDGTENYLVIGFDPLLHKQARISWLEDSEGKEITNLLVDIIVDCNINMDELLAVVAEVRKGAKND